MTTFKVKKNFGLSLNQNGKYKFRWFFGKWLVLVPCNKYLAKFILWVNKNGV